MVLILIFITSLLSRKVFMFFEMYFVCYIFTAFHEAMHMFAASMFNKIPRRLALNVSGLCLSYNYELEKNFISWLIIYIAGPISNILLSLIFKDNVFIKNINIILAIVNLLPIYPLDGYNILLTIFKMFKWNITKIQILSEFVLLLLLIGGILFFMVTKNFSLLVLPAMIFFIKRVNL